MALYAYGLQGFYTSQVVQDFFHQQYVRDTLGHLNMFSRIFRRSLAILSWSSSDYCNTCCFSGSLLSRFCEHRSQKKTPWMNKDVFVVSTWGHPSFTQWSVQILFMFTPSLGRFRGWQTCFNFVEIPTLLQKTVAKPLFLWTRFYRGDESKDMTVRTSNSRLVCQPIKARTWPLKGSIWPSSLDHIGSAYGIFSHVYREKIYKSTANVDNHAKIHVYINTDPMEFSINGAHDIWVYLMLPSK